MEITHGRDRETGQRYDLESRWANGSEYGYEARCDTEDESFFGLAHTELGARRIALRKMRSSMGRCSVYGA